MNKPPHQISAARIAQSLKPRFWCGGKRFRRLPGFTMLEIVVMLAIMVLLASMVLTNFSAFNESGALLSGAQTLALDLRFMQSIVLSVARVQLKNGNYYNGTFAGDPNVANATSPKAVGIHFDKSAGSRKTYLEFVDVPPPLNRLYEALVDADVAVKTFNRGIYINRIYVDGTCGNTDFTTADVVFDSPDSAVTIDGDGFNITGSCSFIKIELKSPTLNLTRTITIRITGQISNQ